jgi:hypothetical protein
MGTQIETAYLRINKCLVLKSKNLQGKTMRKSGEVNTKKHETLFIANTLRKYNMFPLATGLPTESSNFLLS